jgi:3-methyladenine DNA glycosylase AlkD
MKSWTSRTKKYEAKDVLKELRSKGDPKAVEGMKRFGIRSSEIYGVSIPEIRALAKKLGRDHLIALDLWKTGVHEARILASMVDDPKLLTEAQMESWVGDFDSWDLCDQCCGNLFDKTEFAFNKAKAWSLRKEEFVRRAGFASMAWLAVHDKTSPDQEFEGFLELIEQRGGHDDRNFVKKSVNWALRQIGKRNSRLNARAIAVASAMLEKKDLPAAKWIASDALKELKSDAVQKKLKSRKS